MPANHIGELLVMIGDCRVTGGEYEKKLRNIESSIRNFHISLRHAISLQLEDIFSSVRKVLSAIHNQDGQGSQKACYCGQPRGIAPSLPCTQCKDWVHIECLPAYAKASRKFVCPLCDDTCEVNRPTHAELRALLEAARQLHAQVPEEAQLDAIIKHYQQWHGHVTGLLDGHDASRLVGGDPGGLLPDSVVSSILKQTVMVAVDSTALQERVVDHQKCEAWRIRVRDLLLMGERVKKQIPKCRKEEVPIRWNDMKPTVGDLQRLLAETPGFRMDHAQDSMVCAAKSAISVCEKWAAEGRVVEALLGSHAGEPICHVPAELLERTESHIRRAQQIPVHVDADVLEYLVHQSTPYCLCKKTNEIDRPMLACEEEEKCPVLWYHYECVGLDPDIAPPPGYKCPHCCASEEKPYPYELPQKFAVDLANQYSAETLFGLRVSDNEGSDDGLKTNGTLKGFHSPAGTSKPGSDMGHYLADLAVQWSAMSEGDQAQALCRLQDKVRDETRRLQDGNRKH